MQDRNHGVTDTLDRLQRTWTRLVMSGKPNGLAEKPDLLGSLEQIAGEFNQLRGELRGALAETRERETAVELGTRAQIAIDILIRNLFERTADVGFLAEDGAIIDALGAGEHADPAALRRRLEEYVAKYSVYDDVGVFHADGRLHATRLGTASRLQADDTLVATALARPGVFHEIFRLGPDLEPQLLYVQSIPGPNRSPIGVLTLSFRFADEMAGIFASLLKGASAGFMLGIVDAEDRVIAGSPGLTPGTILRLGAACIETVTLNDAEYFATRRPTRGYQGFSGLGWSGVALRPTAIGEAPSEDGDAGDAGEEHAARQISDSAIVSDGLKRISRRAYAIDSDLHLIGLNGKIAADRESNRVLPAVLASIREVGEQIRNAVHGAIGVLYDDAHRNLGQEADQMAVLGVDIMDRNLYERANDCRWWALTPRFRSVLAARDGDGQALSAAERAEVGRILGYINGLYTVYSTLLVFDAGGRVVADSKDGGRIGEKLEGAHIAAALAGRDAQAYSVSDFVATPLYGDRPTYVYCGSILAPGGGRAVGGVAVVFDSEPQFSQMLADVLPLDDRGAPYPGSFAAFVNAAGTVISSTDDGRLPGSRLDADAIARYRVLARAPSRGYRAFKTADGYRDPVTCLVAIPG